MKTFTTFMENEEQEGAVERVLTFMHYTDKDHPMYDITQNFLEDPDSVEFNDLVTFLDDYACPDMCLGIDPVRFAAMMKSLSRHWKQIGKI
jgi:hypothetical protein